PLGRDHCGLRAAGVRLHRAADGGVGRRPLPVADDPRPDPAAGAVGRDLRVLRKQSVLHEVSVMASVDVFVPCYNYGRFLRDAVGSVLAQEGGAVRVLTLDDCSTDDSGAAGRALAVAAPRVEYRRHAVNRGHTATYNEGVEWAAADCCLLLSADDMLT